MYSAKLFPNDPDKLVKNPDLLKDDRELNWKIAAAYWGKRVHPNLVGELKNKFGISISSINSIECDAERMHKTELNVNLSMSSL